MCARVFKGGGGLTLLRLGVILHPSVPPTLLTLNSSSTSGANDAGTKTKATPATLLQLSKEQAEQPQQKHGGMHGFPSPEQPQVSGRVCMCVYRHLWVDGWTYIHTCTPFFSALR